MNKLRAVVRWTIAHHVSLVWLITAAAIALAVLVMSVSEMDTFGTEVVIPVGFWGAIGFICYYSGLVRWWDNPVGRIIAGLDLAFALITAVPTAHAELGVKFSTAVEIRVLFIGLTVGAIMIISRILLVGALSGWRPTLPWKLPKVENEDTSD